MIEDDALEKSVFEEIPTEKIYSQRAITLGTLLGGPLVAGYCISENFKAFNDFEKAKKTWQITFITALSVVVLAFILPENFPTIVFPIIYAWITSYFLKTHQEENIKRHLDNGGELYSGWRVALIGLISTIVFASVIVSISLLIDYV